MSMAPEADDEARRTMVGSKSLQNSSIDTSPDLSSSRESKIISMSTHGDMHQYSSPREAQVDVNGRDVPADIRFRMHARTQAHSPLTGSCSCTWSWSLITFANSSLSVGCHLGERGAATRRNQAGGAGAVSACAACEAETVHCAASARPLQTSARRRHGELQGSQVLGALGGVARTGAPIMPDRSISADWNASLRASRAPSASVLPCVDLARRNVICCS